MRHQHTGMVSHQLNFRSYVPTNVDISLLAVFTRYIALLVRSHASCWSCQIEKSMHISSAINGSSYHLLSCNIVFHYPFIALCLKNSLARFERMSLIESCYATYKNIRLNSFQMRFQMRFQSRFQICVELDHTLLVESRNLMWASFRPWRGAHYVRFNLKVR